MPLHIVSSRNFLSYCYTLDMEERRDKTFRMACNSIAVYFSIYVAVTIVLFTFKVVF